VKFIMLGVSFSVLELAPKPARATAAQLA